MIAIRCFGHFWSKELVNWGSRGQGAGGRLEGYQLRDRKPFKVDFKDQIAVYALFAEDREPIYVGQTGAGEQRLLLRLQHSQGPLRDRWTHFSWFGLREVNDSNGKLSEHQKPESRCGARIPKLSMRRNLFFSNCLSRALTNKVHGGAKKRKSTFNILNKNSETRCLQIPKSKNSMKNSMRSSNRSRILAVTNVL